MSVVVRCFLMLVCCVLFDVWFDRCSLFVVRRLLFVVGCLLIVVCCLFLCLLAVVCELGVGRCLPFVVCCADAAVSL